MTISYFVLNTKKRSYWCPFNVFGIAFISESEIKSVGGVGIALAVLIAVTMMFCIVLSKPPGLVVLNFVSLTLLLSPEFVNYISLLKQIHCYFLLKKCENPLQCKRFSHFLTKK